MTTLNTLEAAQVLKVHRNKIEQLINAGAIPAAKVGRAWVMLERDVMKYLEKQITNQTAARLGQGSQA